MGKKVKNPSPFVAVLQTAIPINNPTYNPANVRADFLFLYSIALLSDKNNRNVIFSLFFKA